MGRNVAIFWHASFSILAGVVYCVAVLPRKFELMGQISHAVGTTGRIVCGVLIGLTALPVVFTLLRTRRPEYGTPQLALTLRTGSIVAHVLAAVLIVGTAISELWLSLDDAGQWLFGVYGAAAAIAVLGIFAFYLSFVAELPPPPPKPLKPKKARQRGRKKGRAKDKDKKGADTDTDQSATDEDEESGTGEAQEAATPESEPAEATAALDEPATAETPAGAPESPESSQTDDLPAAEDTVAVEAPRGGLRNRRPSGKSATSRRRRRPHGGVALDD